TETKRIRTKKGDPMMFATLDDLEASVELLVFGNVLATAGEVLAQDSIVLVRGRVDHKDRETTCVVVQQVERFEPTAEEVEQAREQAARRPAMPSALRLRLDATALAASVLSELKDVLAGFPGESEVVIELSTSVGERRLKLGPEFRVAHGPGLHAELDALLGDAILSGSDATRNVSVASERRQASVA
ncbi:MAG TPA: OB-fold nucleic acid binding domain-containing protein, partial [Solirubrobacteraceae bacterium]|nr:OB-fold nucleic acid binding domain-containing protein [Solirubrobacteraceae bacterium]